MAILWRLCLPALTISSLCRIRAVATADPTGSGHAASYVDGLGNELNAAVDATGEPVERTTGRSRRSELVRGLFGAYRRNRKHSSAPPPPDRRRDDRPVDADRATAGVNATGHGEAAATVGPPERTVFGTEDECVTATDDRRRPCVCHMVDYLGWVAQRSDEPVAAGDGARAFDCQSYKAVPAAFVVRPTDDDPAARPANDSRTDRGPDDEPARDEVRLDRVIDYRLAGPGKDHYAVHYGLLGSDVKLRCLDNGTGINAFKWIYDTGTHKTNSTIIGNDTINLSILGLEPADSKNYTCTPETDAVKNDKTDGSYVYYVIVVGNPVYEIHGTAIYKTSGSSVCTHENVEPVRKQLPSFVRAELCPEGSTRYACNVVVEWSKCAEDQRTLEIKLLVTLNEKADFLTKIRASRQGRNALRYQQALARVFNVLAANLNKTLTVDIVSKFSLIDTRFESEHGRTKVKTFVTCAPGFGIREVFCVACPPHHFSGNKSVNCLKCPKGFHQPVAGSDKCLKCPHPFASGCYMKEVPAYIYYVTILVVLLVFVVFVASCLCCCREENEKNIRIIPRNIRKKFKKSKGYDLM